MINRKLVRVEKNNYYFLINGIKVAKGPLSWCKTQLAKYGISEIQLALAAEVMTDNKDEVADFGVNGQFIISQKFKDAQLGLYNKRYEETHYGH